MKIKRSLPAYPLFVKDPFYSVWLAGESLTQDKTVFWHGEYKPMRGEVLFNGKKYTFLGKGENALAQTALEITAFSTKAQFECDEFTLDVEFLSPLLPNNLDVLANPTCYLFYTVTPKCGAERIQVIFGVEERIAYDTSVDEDRMAETRGGVLQCPFGEVAYFGLRRQMLFSNSNDECGADWGYYYLTGEESFNCEENGRRWLIAKNAYEKADGAISGKFLLAFDDVCSIEYFGEMLKGYYFRDGKTVMDALEEAYASAETVKAECEAFDAALRKEAAPFGEEYLQILYASLRQSVGAHKLVQDKKGRILFLSKECNSNGSIATADVSYPSMPLYLLYNPVLLKGMLYPILDFARMPVWKYDFAPHDVGVYPLCRGQAYALYNLPDKYSYDVAAKPDVKVRDVIPNFYTFPAQTSPYQFEKQMPVEECANMLIMTMALYRAEGDVFFIREHYDLFEGWVDYLVQYGLIPANQLCTDDFAGHMDKNINLSVKAIVGIGCFAEMCKLLGKEEEAKAYRIKAEEYAAIWKEKCDRGDHSPLTFESDDTTFSLKYNLLFDKLLKLNLFEQALMEKEVDYYLTRLNRYGVPLDSRAAYTKTDWIMWAVALTDCHEKQVPFMQSLVNFLQETKQRVPFGDWIETVTGDYIVFRNRTVQGGNFSLLLKKAWLK